MLIASVVEEFLTYLEAENGCSALTVRAYRSDLRQFLSFLAEQGLTPEVEAIDVGVLRQYLVAMTVAGLKPSTRSRRLAALRSLWSYLVDSGIATTNPCRRLRLPRKPRPAPSCLTAEECVRLLQATDRSHYDALAFRDRAILTLLLFTGLRRGELLSLSVHDVDLDARMLRVVRGKGGRSRTVPLREVAVQAVSDWLEFRPACRHAVLFTSRTGKALRANDLQRMFRRVLAQAGIERPGITLHKLRHTFATMLLRQGVSVAVLQRLLGHASLEMTAVYLDVTAEDLREAVSRHPMGV
jgi:site-specific recombinase XerD